MSQQQLATALGMHSKGYISRIERGLAAPIKLALEIERLSDGAVSALELVGNEDAELLRDFVARSNGKPGLPATPAGRA